MGYTEYVAACAADSPTVTAEVDSGAAAPFTGAKAKAYTGLSGSYTLVSGLGYPSAWTIEFWAKPTSQKTNPVAIAIQGADSTKQSLMVVGEDTLQTIFMWHMGDTSLNWEQDSLAADWHHYVFTADYGTSYLSRLYIDGVQKDTGNVSDIFNQTQGIAIGGSPVYGMYFAGLISQVRGYDHEVPADRILAHYTAATSAAAAPVTISAVQATGTAKALLPSVVLGPVTITAAKATGTAQGLVPTVTGTSSLGVSQVVSAPAAASGRAYAPSVGPPVTITLRGTIIAQGVALTPTVIAVDPAYAKYSAAVNVDSPVIRYEPNEEIPAPATFYFPNAQYGDENAYVGQEPFTGAGGTATLNYFGGGKKKVPNTGDYWLTGIDGTQFTKTAVTPNGTTVLNPDTFPPGPFTVEFWHGFGNLQTYSASGLTLHAYGDIHDPLGSTDDVSITIGYRDQSIGRKNANQELVYEIIPMPTLQSYWRGAGMIMYEDDSLRGKWHHYVLSSDGLTNRLYIDGVQVGSQRIPQPTVGFRWVTFGGATEAFSSFSQIAFYDHALTPDRVLAHYRAAKNIPPSNVTIAAVQATGSAKMLPTGSNVVVSATQAKGSGRGVVPRLFGEVVVGQVSLEAARFLATSRALTPQVVSPDPAPAPVVVGSTSLPWRRQGISVHTRPVRISVTQN